jgi:hypothetical protein
MTTTLELPEAPAALRPALRKLATAAFDLEQVIAVPGKRPMPIDEEVVALSAAMQRVSALFRAWSR